MLQYFYIFVFCVISNFFLVKVFNKFQIFQPQRNNTDKKKMVPTFGGISFLVVFLFLIKEDWNLFLLAIFVGLIGFFDDFIKVRRFNTNGICSLYKLCAEIFFVSIYIFFSDINRPWLVHPLFMSVFLVFVLVSFINAVNISDGIDSLSASTAIVCLFFLYLKTNDNVILKLMTMLFAFLLFNRPSACLYMGDVGSLGLGAVLGGLFIKYNFEWAFLFVGFVYVLEISSSFIQIFSIRVFKKKFFLLAPFHHHLFLNGYSKAGVLFIFNFLTILGFTISLYFF